MSQFKLSIDLNVLNHLGLNLYSNVPAVLSELIANAWDAESKIVKITTTKNDQITLEDDGCGMSLEDLNTKFLNVGYQRRKDAEDDKTPILGRKVMGRKGIGKLSIFSIAETIEIYTKTQEGHLLGLRMKTDEIQNKIKEKEIYEPEEIKFDGSNSFDKKSGTKIVLKRIKKRVQSSLSTNLRKRIARRFDILSDQFVVQVDGKAVGIEDQNYFHKLEFATIYGDYPKEYFSKVEDHKIIRRQTNIGLVGWIGLVSESGSLDEVDNLNKISILSRGKVALEDILEQYREGGLYTKYLIGQIRADFLDETSAEDIATSNRQGFITDDERFVQLKKIIFDELKFIQQERVKYKEEEGEKKAREIPAIDRWFKSLGSDTKKAAKKLFGKINKISTDETHRKTLLKHGVLAFESLQHRDKLQQLQELNPENFEIAVELFCQLDDIEASWYHEITKSRLEVINQLKQHTDANALEKILQKYIYDHLWLLDPSWDKATETPYMEKRITQAFESISSKISKEETAGRPDIRYKKTAGKHIIIELKRAGVTVKKGELSDQLNKYKTALRKQLDNAKEEGAIECICLLGKLPQGWDESSTRQEGENSLAAENIRVITYEQLIRDAQLMYQQYLDKEKDRGRIRQLLNEIDQDIDTNPSN